jgi:microcin C transport system substrate-binding protein
MKIRWFILAVLLLTAFTIGAESAITISNSISLRGTPKYGEDFTHFDYVNPNAPQGGTLVEYTIGTYDNFNRYASRGVSVVASTAMYDSLMVYSSDEVNVLYGLIAEKIEYPDDYSWIIFHLNPKATHQDGKSITSEDVKFSFETFMEEGVEQFRQYFSNVEKVEILDDHRIKFSMLEGSKEFLMDLGTRTVIPKHYWESREFSEPSTEVPLGTGAYTISDYKIGQYVIYKRLPDYWGMDVPSVKGTLNYDYVRYDYYRDQNVAFEAFKAGEYDIRQESISKNWATLYTGPLFDSGRIVKQQIPHEIPQGMQAFVYNIQRPMFEDRRVRMALNYAMDFQWMNENLFYDQYTRARSYFQNTPYEATGLPSAAELKILNPIRDKIPPEVFTAEYNPPVTDGSGQIRTEIRLALKLLKDAGWEIQDKKLTNVKTGQPMEFELLLYSPSMERVAIAVEKNMERLGVTMRIRVVDTTQFTNRLRERDFDMISGYYSTGHYPESSLKIVWRSDYIDYTYNTAGVMDDAVDYLIDGIEANQDDEDALLAWGRALDRVLTWNNYVMPQWFINSFRVAYWNKFGIPGVRPKYSLGTETWWIDPVKEAALGRQK